VGEQCLLLSLCLHCDAMVRRWSTISSRPCRYTSDARNKESGRALFCRCTAPGPSEMSPPATSRQTESSCSFLVLSGTTIFKDATPKLYAPRLPTITSPQEARVLQDVADTTQLRTIATALQTHNGDSSLAAVLHTYTSPLPRRPSLDWHTPVIIVLVTISGIYFYYQVVFLGLRKLIAWETIKSLPSTDRGTPSHEAPSTNHWTNSNSKPTEPEPAVHLIKH
jgi:hypothetical protein